MVFSIAAAISFWAVLRITGIFIYTCGKKIWNNLYSARSCHYFTRFSQSSSPLMKFVYHAIMYKCLAMPIFKNCRFLSFPAHVIKAYVKHGKTNISEQNCQYSHNHFSRTNQNPDFQTPWCIYKHILGSRREFSPPHPENCTVLTTRQFVVKQEPGKFRSVMPPITGENGKNIRFQMQIVISWQSALGSSPKITAPGLFSSRGPRHSTLRQDEALKTTKSVRFSCSYSITFPASVYWIRMMFSHMGKGTCFMMTSSNGNIFRVTGHLCGEFTGPRWIPLTKASEAELWCFLWSATE